MSENINARDGVVEVQAPSTGAVQALAQVTGKPRRARAAGSAPSNLCGESTKAGGACRTPKMSGRSRCRFHEAQHDPALGALVATDRQRGGAIRTVREFGLDIPVDLSTPESTRTVAERVAGAVLAGKITASQAQAVSTLITAALRATEAAVTRDLEELERRIEEELEARGRG